MEHTDQVIYDTSFMKEEEFLEYYKLYWQENIRVVKEQYDIIKARIKKGDYEVVCYLVLDNKTGKDHFFHKSAICYLQDAFKAAENNKEEISLRRCDTFEGIVRKSADIEVEVDVDYITQNFPNRSDQVAALYYSGITSCSKIADILKTNASYVNRLLTKIKFDK